MKTNNEAAQKIKELTEVKTLKFVIFWFCYMLIVSSGHIYLQCFKMCYTCSLVHGIYVCVTRTGWIYVQNNQVTITELLKAKKVFWIRHFSEKL